MIRVSVILLNSLLLLVLETAQLRCQTPADSLNPATVKIDTSKSISKYPQPTVDEVLFRSINAWGTASDNIDNFMIAASGSLIYTSIATPVGLYIYGRTKPDLHANLAGLGVAMTEVGAGLITTVLKEVVQRPRPFNALKNVRIPGGGETGYSFPSGHATIAWALATSASLYYPKWYVIAPATVYATVVSLSRPYLGVHYPLDLIVGAVIGAGSAFVVHSVARPLFAHTPWLFPKGANLTSASLAYTSIPIVSMSIPLATGALR